MGSFGGPDPLKICMIGNSMFSPTLGETGGTRPPQNLEWGTPMYNVPPDFDIFSVFFPYSEEHATPTHPVPSSMTEVRINSVAVCQCQQQLIDALDIKPLLREFVSRSDLHMSLFGRVV